MNFDESSKNYLRRNNWNRGMLEYCKSIFRLRTVVLDLSWIIDKQILPEAVIYLTKQKNKSQEKILENNEIDENSGIQHKII
jgi:hypothetical protein